MNIKQNLSKLQNVCNHVHVAHCYYRTTKLPGASESGDAGDILEVEKLPVINISYQYC